MSTQVIHGGTTDKLGTGNQYTTAFGSRIIGGSFSNIRWPAAGDVRHLIVQLSHPPGAGNTRRIELVELNVTKLAMTFGAGDTELEDTATEAITLGNNVRMHSHTTGTPTAAWMRYAYLWEPTTPGQTIVGCCTDTTKLSTSLTEYLPMSGALGAISTVAGAARIWLPVPGTISDTYVRLSDAPRSGRSRTFQWERNGTLTLSQKVTIADLATTGQDTSGSFHVGEGGHVAIRSLPTNTPWASYVSIGAVFTPDDPDYFLVGSTGEGYLPVGTVENWRQFQSGNDCFTTADVAKYTVAHKMLVDRGRFHISQLPVSGAWGILLNRIWGPRVSSAVFAPGGDIDHLSIAPILYNEWQPIHLVAVAAGIPNTIPTNRTRLAACFACKMAETRPAPFMV
jgi:hypothetical protein